MQALLNAGHDAQYRDECAPLPNRRISESLAASLPAIAVFAAF